jgi:2-polyprenyl-3-methyl-5-hydroxy-6-metoxy-1,4-benzoquinol methylase
MKQTPVHDGFNPVLLELMKIASYRALVEVGCSRGTLARVYRESHPEAGYVGIELEAERAQVAQQYCSRVICGDIESLAAAEWNSLFPSDCWIFGDSLEHLRDPWSVLQRLRHDIPPTAQVLACVPNAQHWSVQARLAIGNLQYEDYGLLDRSHLRWFTRRTAIEMFELAGFRVVELLPRVFPEPQRDSFLPAIRAMAVAAGADPDMAAQDSMAFQYVLKAIPL